MGPFHVHAPAMVLGAGTAEDAAIAELDRFVADGTINIFGEAFIIEPRFTAIMGDFDQTPPFGRAGAFLIKKVQGTILWLKENRVPKRVADADVIMDAGGDFDRIRPAVSRVASEPDADIASALGGAAKPSGDEGIVHLDDRRGVDGAGGAGEEFRAHVSGLVCDGGFILLSVDAGTERHTQRTKTK